MCSAVVASVKQRSALASRIVILCQYALDFAAATQRRGLVMSSLSQ
jgi:hypothetical protein